MAIIALTSLSNWLDDFLTSYYKHRPVNATFVGVHTYDDRLPDFSRESVAQLQSEMESLLARLRGAENSQKPNTSQQLDRLLAGNYLEIQLAELSSHHFHLGNPALYTGEAIFGVISLFLRDFAPLADRVKSAISRLKAIPGLLEQGMTNVRSTPKEWTQKAIQECTGAMHFLGNGIELLMQSLNVNSPPLRAAAQSALAEVQEYRDYLSSELLSHASSDYACDKQFYDMLIRKGHCLEMNGEQVAEYGMDRLRERQEQLQREASTFRRDGDWRKILASLEDSHPSQEGYLQSFHTLWQECVRIATEHSLLTWPNYPLRYTFVPTYFREAAPFLYFLPYRSPAAFDPVSTYDYLVTPIEASMPSNEQERRLRTMNYSVIKLNHVVHHGSIGHHLQNYHAYRSATRIGQIAAVDCASRIAMFCGGTMAEGWACYSTDIIRDLGFYTELEQFAQLHSQLRQTARAIADPNLHLGKFTFDEAVQFYTTHVGMSVEAARSEVTKNSMFPATAAMYLLGTDCIHKLREEFAKKDSSFSMSKFHDRFLKYGSVPVSLIASDMLGTRFSLID